MSNESDNEDSEDQPAAEYVAELVEDGEAKATGEEAKATGEEAKASGEESETIITAEPVVAAVATPAVAYNPSILTPPKPASYQQPPSPMANLSAKGGAVGAVVLGGLSFFGSFITSYAILNSFMGLALGLWGLRSNHRRMAIVGMAICVLSAFFCALDISEWLQGLWVTEEFE